MSKTQSARKNEVLEQYYRDYDDRLARAEAMARGNAEPQRSIPDTVDGNVTAEYFAGTEDVDSGSRIVQAMREAANVLSDPPPMLDAVANALMTLAAFFNHPEPSFWDNGESYNGLGRQQRLVMSNLCNNAQFALESAIKYRQDLGTKLDQQEALADGGEISNRNINVTLDQLERSTTLQIPTAKDWLAITKAAYAEVFGEEWKPYAKAKTAHELSADATRARIEAYRSGKAG